MGNRRLSGASDPCLTRGASLRSMRPTHHLEADSEMVNPAPVMTLAYWNTISDHLCPPEVLHNSGACRSGLELLPACGDVAGPGRRLLTRLNILEMGAYSFLQFAEKQFKDDLKMLERAACVAHHVLLMPSLHDSRKQQNAGTRRWMETEAGELNKFLNPFGVVLYELREGSLDFTISHTDPVTPCDPKAVVLFLATCWFLREHRCFSGISLNVSVVERFRPGQFQQHITFAKQVVTFHLIDVEGIELLFTMCPLVLALDQTKLLAHVTLDRILDMEAHRFLHFAENQLKDEPEFLDRAADVARDVLEMPSRLDSCTQQNEGGARCWMFLQHITVAKWVVPVHLIGVEELRFRMFSMLGYSTKRSCLRTSLSTGLAQEFKEHRRLREFELLGTITRTELVSRLLDTSF
ncbi:hypothetical protein HPB49_025029 [Dermacentor silvarum]|uniref:Uncharacterized protein n=1 Tax=Dermacentor silvarum TaxID=543639 RepID=A0ACB8DL79_DERSI|nr:hypothetical protein HPB49_025029 [Dermacentor silvarum]